MARESVKILQGKLDVESLIAQLNAALAEEWLAYYQYCRCISSGRRHACRCTG